MSSRGAETSGGATLDLQYNTNQKGLSILHFRFWFCVCPPWGGYGNFLQLHNAQPRSQGSHNPGNEVAQRRPLPFVKIVSFYYVF